MVRRMGPLTSGRLVRIAGYVSAIVAGLLVVLAAALLLDVWDPEPSEAAVLMVIGLSAVVAVLLGRATYRGVVGVFSRTSDPRM
jgi:chromate transport protein ChrA